MSWDFWAGLTVASLLVASVAVVVFMLIVATPVLAWIWVPALLVAWFAASRAERKR